MMDKKELEIMEMDKVSGGYLWSDPAVPPWDHEIPDELNPVIERQNQ